MISANWYLKLTECMWYTFLNISTNYTARKYALFQGTLNITCGQYAHQIKKHTNAIKWKPHSYKIYIKIQNDEKYISETVIYNFQKINMPN